MVDDRVKDITAKYSPNWGTLLRKLRLDDEWWNSVLEPYKPMSSCIRNVSEDQLIHGNCLDRQRCQY